jgi:pilus assembly protein Flp/PilA
MNVLSTKILSFFLSDEGATAIEYGLIAGGIALAIVAVIFSLGTDVRTVFNTLGSTMQSVNSTAQASGG